MNRSMEKYGTFDGMLWKKASPDWIRQTMPYYSYWEVLNGAYDDLCESWACYLR